MVEFSFMTRGDARRLLLRRSSNRDPLCSWPLLCGPDDWPKSDLDFMKCAWRRRHVAELDQSQMAFAVRVRSQDQIGGRAQIAGPTVTLCAASFTPRFISSNHDPLSSNVIRCIDHSSSANILAEVLLKSCTTKHSAMAQLHAKLRSFNKAE
jgi:hypothetical protein